jgi:DNA-binding IclR family transcriptional regulator
MHNYLGLAVHDAEGTVVGTVCVLDDSARDYTDEQRAELARLRGEVEQIVRQDGTALS